MEQFEDRILFMSMSNDIDLGNIENKENCSANSREVEAHARRFPKGHWSCYPDHEPKKISWNGQCEEAKGRVSICEQHTAPRAFDTCRTRIFFSCARGSRCVSIVLRLVFLDSQSISSMLHRAMFDALLSSFLPTPFQKLPPNPMSTPPLLNSSTSPKPCATPQGGLLFGHLAEQSPLTGL